MYQRNISNFYYNHKQSFIQAISIQRYNKDKSLNLYFSIIRRYIKRHPVLREILGYNKPINRGNLSVFVVRNNALELNLLNLIIEKILLYKFRIIDIVILNSNKSNRISKELRGGNWSIDQKISKNATGVPEAFIITFDLNPIFVSNKYYRIYPEIDNCRLVIKRKIRSILNQTISPEMESNFLHVTDNEKQAWKYIQIGIPERINRIKSIICLNYFPCPKCRNRNYISHAENVCKKCGYNNQPIQYQENNKFTFLQKIKIVCYYNLYQSLWWKYKCLLRKFRLKICYKKKFSIIARNFSQIIKIIPLIPKKLNLSMEDSKIYQFILQNSIKI